MGHPIVLAVAEKPSIATSIAAALAPSGYTTRRSFQDVHEFYAAFRGQQARGSPAGQVNDEQSAVADRKCRGHETRPVQKPGRPDEAIYVLTEWKSLSRSRASAVEGPTAPFCCRRNPPQIATCLTVPSRRRQAEFRVTSVIGHVYNVDFPQPFQRRGSSPRIAALRCCFLELLRHRRGIVSSAQSRISFAAAGTSIRPCFSPRRS